MRIGGVGAACDRGDDHVAIRKPLCWRFRLIWKGGGEGLRDGGQCYLLLRPTRSGDKGLDSREINGQLIAERRLPGIVAPQARGLGVASDVLDQCLVPPCLAQVAESFVVDREEPAGRAVLRGHVGDGRSVAEGEVAQALAMDPHALADDTVLPESEALRV